MSVRQATDQLIWDIPPKPSGGVPVRMSHLSQLATASHWTDVAYVIYDVFVENLKLRESHTIGPFEPPMSCGCNLVSNLISN